MAISDGVDTFMTQTVPSPDGIRSRACHARRCRLVLCGIFCLAACLSLPPSLAAALPGDAAPLSGYTVRRGDTLYDIGRRHGLSVARLKSLNGLRGDLLKPGQYLVFERPAKPSSHPGLPVVGGLWSVVEPFLGTPYRFGGSDAEGLDCSAFVQQVFRSFDIALPRSAREQYCYGAEVDRDELRVGDLLFFRTYAQYPSHVGIYLADGKMVHASARSRRVVASDIGLPYFRKRFIGARRLAAFDAADVDVAALDVVNEVPADEDGERTEDAAGPAPDSARTGE